MVLREIIGHGTRACHPTASGAALGLTRARILDTQRDPPLITWTVGKAGSVSASGQLLVQERDPLSLSGIGPGAGSAVVRSGVARQRFLPVRPARRPMRMGLRLKCPGVGSRSSGRETGGLMMNWPATENRRCIRPGTLSPEFRLLCAMVSEWSDACASLGACVLVREVQHGEPDGGRRGRLGGGGSVAVAMTVCGREAYV
jgi:hypothetical protein